MRPGERLTLIGTIVKRSALQAKTGTRFVKAQLDCGSDGTMPVVWWAESQAPSLGTRVSVTGVVREYNGMLELHADQTRIERALPADPLARVVGYYLDCVDAESTEDLAAPRGSSRYVELGAGVAPMFSDSPVPIPADRAAQNWCAQRMAAIGESVLAGYPLVQGQSHDSQAISVSPLFVTEVVLRRTTAGFEVERLSQGLDVNPAALDVLGMSRDEREECLLTLETSPEFESGPLHDRLRAGMRIVLDCAGRTSDQDFDPLDLDPLEPGQVGLHNTAALIATQGGSVYTKRLVEDLEALVAQPQSLHEGPLGVLLGAIKASPMPLPASHPIMVPSTIRQDQAVHSAMTVPFTVVTGPPGTGKSQVLVNVIAAALANGESVLFASKNNKAVDVVYERIKLVSPNSNVMRAGSSSMRGMVASTIGDALTRGTSGQDVASLRAPQSRTDAEVNQVLGRLRERQGLEVEAARQLTLLNDRLRALPSGVDIDSDADEVREAMRNLTAAFNAFGGKLPLLRRGARWSIHRARLAAAIAGAETLNNALGRRHLESFDVEKALSSVLTKPTRTLGLITALSGLQKTVTALEEAQEAQQRRFELLERIDRDFQKWSIEDALAQLQSRRLETGRALVDALWPERLTQAPAAVHQARLLRDDLAAAHAGGAGATAAKRRIEGALPALPVWGVTNLSVGANFPLQQGLFDLVVIDEASQCDPASAIPLLFRAKRALIIGDQRQLTHITQIGSARSASIARRWQLDDATHDTFNYRSRSTFTLAATRVGDPLLLDLHFRSQPAIIAFSNATFYGGNLEICTQATTRSELDEPTIRWHDVDGDAQRGGNGRSWRNLHEAESVVEELGALLPRLTGLGMSIGVVTPYRAQVEEIRQLASRRLGPEVDGVSIDTAHRFQGDERDVMLLSPVVGHSMNASQIRFAADPNLINVALTRARRHLIVVGNRGACLLGGTVLAQFATYVSRLEASSFDSPLELDLYEELLRRGVAAQPGWLVAGYRLDLAIEQGRTRLDIECDGAAFHQIPAADRERDAAIELQGWQVIRLSGRELSRDIRACAERVLGHLHA